ncbi:phasin family protein [Paenibacillus sp. Marseille-Q4541]|uniref:phasin family protein n=1 Tax=Paenibacillus sp. Marseille-Q4541 TaxID=2831522 RepID=UPI001BAD7AB0|nr:phasin family protein [Paenibacillus sp. Marseille-Q4541]
MSDLFKKAVSLGWGLTLVSKEKVENAVGDLVKRGELAPSESKALIEKLMERGNEEQTSFKKMIEGQVEKVLIDLGVPTKTDVNRLNMRIEELEQKLSALEAGQPVKHPDTPILTSTPEIEQPPKGNEIE